MANHVPAVRCTKTRHSCMRTSLSSADVSWRTLTGYPSYALNRACTLPFHSPFHYVMAKIVPAMQLATHAKSSTLYGRSHGLKLVLFRTSIAHALCSNVRWTRVRLWRSRAPVQLTVYAESSTLCGCTIVSLSLFFFLGLMGYYIYGGYASRAGSSANIMFKRIFVTRKERHCV